MSCTMDYREKTSGLQKTFGKKITSVSSNTVVFQLAASALGIPLLLTLFLALIQTCRSWKALVNSRYASTYVSTKQKSIKSRTYKITTTIIIIIIKIIIICK